MSLLSNVPLQGQQNRDAGTLKQQEKLCKWEDISLYTHMTCRKNCQVDFHFKKQIYPCLHFLSKTTSKLSN